MNEDQPRRPRPIPKARTGKHYCIECLKEVPEEEYFRNDHVCDDCGSRQERQPEEPRKDE